MSIWKRKFRTEMGHQKTQCGGDKRTSPTPFLSLNLAQDCSKKNFFLSVTKVRMYKKYGSITLGQKKRKDGPLHCSIIYKSQDIETT